MTRCVVLQLLDVGFGLPMRRMDELSEAELSRCSARQCAASASRSFSSALLSDASAMRRFSFAGRFIAVPMHSASMQSLCQALLRYSIALLLYALPLRCQAIPFLRFAYAAMRCDSVPMLCSVQRRLSDPSLGAVPLCSAFRCIAVPLLRASAPSPCGAHIRVSLPMRRSSSRGLWPAT